MSFIIEINVESVGQGGKKVFQVIVLVEAVAHFRVERLELPWRVEGHGQENGEIIRKSWGFLGVVVDGGG